MLYMLIYIFTYRLLQTCKAQLPGEQCLLVCLQMHSILQHVLEGLSFGTGVQDILEPWLYMVVRCHRK